MNLSDLYIQKKIQDGDIVEFERLFKKYYSPLCHRADKILRDMDAAEDVVQEFFYHFWKNRESMQHKLSLNANLYQAVRNNALHHLRYLAVRKNYAEQVAGGFNTTMPVHAHEEAELNDLGNLVDATLERMPRRCSRIFRMNRFEGLKYREIAMILSVSVKTVEAEMGKALQIFRKSLKDYNREGAS